MLQRKFKHHKTIGGSSVRPMPAQHNEWLNDYLFKHTVVVYVGGLHLWC